MMTKLIRRAVFSVSVAYLGTGLNPVLAEDANGSTAKARANFVACPMVRNTYVPCWVAQNKGELYYLGPQGDLGAPFHPPQLKHRALIEGVVSDEPRICGGLVLKPVNVSVLPEIDESCNTILPADGYPDPPHHRTPGPSNSEREERPRPAREALAAPFETKTFDVPFAFDVGQHLYSRDSQVVGNAARYASSQQSEQSRSHRLPWRCALVQRRAIDGTRRRGIAASRNDPKDAAARRRAAIELAGALDDRGGARWPR